MRYPQCLDGASFPETCASRPVGLKEAALDSPSFRAAIVHLNDQVDQVEKWLEGCTKAVARVNSEITAFDGVVGNLIGAVLPPASLSEAVVDHDYTLLSVSRHSEIAKESWSATANAFKKLETTLSDPLRGFMHGELRNFKDVRRQLDQSQRTFDSAQTRYSAQTKSKEPSSLREDAFQLFEVRKAYLKASLDYACAGPHLKIALDTLIVNTFRNQSSALQAALDRSSSLTMKAFPDIERIGAWARNVSKGEKEYRRQLLSARRQIEDAAESTMRPSRELEDYSNSSSLGSLGGSRPAAPISSTAPTSATAEKQGWLNLKTTVGKPARSVWNRKWCYVKEGIFGWLVKGSRSGGVEESDRIGVLLCGVRVAATEERRFCFEVKTKDSAIVLQADSIQDLSDWMAIFESAKQNALAAPLRTQDAGPAIGNSGLAFAISPPNVPEFAASAFDAGLNSEENNEKSQSNLAPASIDQNALAHRGSFDISASRRSIALDSDSSRDHAARLIQKLDLHRKSGSGTPATGQTSTSSALPSAPGVATLISASNMALPLVPVGISQTSLVDVSGRLVPMQSQDRAGMTRGIPVSTLAPQTLANPPNPTNLSWTAITVNGERGSNLGWGGDRGSIPNVINANIWGSLSWEPVHWLGQNKPNPSKQLSQASPSQLQGLSPDGRQVEVRSSDRGTTESSGQMPEHRRTISLDGDLADLQRATVSPREPSSNYPAVLRHQDAQFRLLVPNVPRNDKLLLVFRALWILDEEHELPGRAYVTAKNIYFYYHHYGMVLTTGLSLDSIAAVSAKEGPEFDVLSFHLKQRDEAKPRRSSVKVFLEPTQLLRRRLSLLVQNASLMNRLGAEDLMRELLKIETDEEESGGSPGTESQLEISDAHMFDTGHLSRSRDFRAHVLIDQGHEPHLGAQGRKGNVRFKLPNKPVVYIPKGWSTPVVERDFRISPKALFHVMFGDRGAIWQILYQKRHAQNIKQGPWIRESDSHLYRAFEYRIQRRKLIGSYRTFAITDTQTIDVLSDHLCYVVTYRKTPWHLPCFQQFDLATKVVISFVAKSRCKLAIYAKIEWSSRPLLAAALVKEQALQNIKSDVSDIADLVAEQARRLGPGSSTKKAIDIFGSVGQQSQVIEYGDVCRSTKSDLRFTMDEKSVIALLWNALMLLAKHALNLVFLSLSVVAEWSWKLADANIVLLSLFVASFLINLILSTQPFRIWWRERHAITFMARLGIGEKIRMEKGVHLKDIEAVTPSMRHNASYDLDSIW